MGSGTNSKRPAREPSVDDLEREHQNKADEILNRLESLKPGQSLPEGIAGEALPQFNRYSIKELSDFIRDNFIKYGDGLVPADTQIAIMYADGSVKVAGEGDKVPKLSGASSIILEADYGTDFAGKNITFYEYNGEYRKEKRAKGRTLTARDYDNGVNYDFRLDFNYGRR